METLATGLAVFFGAHLFTSARGARAALIERIGEKAYKGIFSLIALLGLALIIWGKSRAPFEHAYDPPAMGRSLTLSLMPLAFILLAASHMPTNLKRVTAHPMLWGIVLWSGLHLLANGDRASLLLFGSFFLYAFYAMASQTLRGVRPKDRAVPLSKDIIVVAAGVIVSVVLVLAHGWISGVPLKS